VYRVLADAVVVVHFGFVLYVMFGGFLAWRLPRTLPFHLAAVAWAIGIVTVEMLCPLTSLENWLRERGGEQAYGGGFVDRYIEDVLYPEEHTALARALVAACVVGAYAGRWLRRRRRAAATPAGQRGSDRSSAAAGTGTSPPHPAG
jgi:hypothetical protein